MMFYLTKEDFPTLGNTPNEKPCVSISNKKGRGEETVLVPCKKVNVKNRRKKITWSRQMDWVIGRTTTADGAVGTKTEMERAIQLPYRGGGGVNDGPSRQAPTTRSHAPRAPLTAHNMDDRGSRCLSPEVFFNNI